jgi:hypothetical protein
LLYLLLITVKKEQKTTNMDLPACATAAAVSAAAAASKILAPKTDQKIRGERYREEVITTQADQGGIPDDSWNTQGN